MASFIGNAALETGSATAFPKRLAILAGLVIFADWLFYGEPLGISLVLFILILAAAVALSASQLNLRQGLALPFIILVGALAPLVEDFGFLSGLIGTLGLAYFTLAITAELPARAGAKLMACTKLLLSGPLRSFQDIAGAIRMALQSEQKARRLETFAIWAVPLAVTGLFTLLFASANPLIGDWLSRIDLWALFSRVSFVRLAFWLLVLIALWPFVFQRPIATAAAETPARKFPAANIPGAGIVFGQAAILRTFLLCNILFAFQTFTDVAYLWLGVALPQGMTYAAYAHRGAYLLIITALLAGAFVITAMRPGSATERSPWIRGLVYLWIAQNILLVLSSALRLNLYVAAYSLTSWRAAAFVWMFLVAVGLAAIVARIALDRSNAWLVSTMLSISAAVLYACSFIDGPRLIATYNVAHCREIAGKGIALDMAYLEDLGPGVIPALDAYRRQVPERIWSSKDGKGLRQRLSDAQRESLDNWRSWTFRGWRLQRCLDAYASGSDISAATPR